MSDTPAQIRSYQRIFRPDRRIYQIDGRQLPIPGGVPLAWLAWATGTLLVVLILSAQSLTLALGIAFVAALVGAALGGWLMASMSAGTAFVSVLAIGAVLGGLHWPLRLIVLPILVATLAGQIAPDGRPAHRYLISWVAFRLRPTRRSLSRALPTASSVEIWAPEIWVAPDEHSPTLHRGRVHGPAQLEFSRPVVVIPRRGRHVLRPAEGHRFRHGELLASVVELRAGEIVEIRP